MPDEHWMGHPGSRKIRCPFPGCDWTRDVTDMPTDQIEPLLVAELETHGFTPDEFRQLHRMERELGQ